MASDLDKWDFCMAGLNKSFTDLDVSIKSKHSFYQNSYRNTDNVFHKTLNVSKSSPNLCKDNQGKENFRSPKLSKTQSNNFVNSPPNLNPHKALTDLYKNFSTNKGSSFIRSFSLRNRPLKRLEDIYNYCNKDNTFAVHIRKRSQRLGLCVSGGRDAAKKDPFHQLIRIWNLHPMQPALESGKLTLGDVILEVNGINMLGLTITEAIAVLRNAPADVELTIYRPSKFLVPSFPPVKESPCSGTDSSCCSNSTDLCSDNKSYSKKSGEFKVALMKKDGCLGFSILRKDSTNHSTAGIFIKALTRDHAVADGRIQKGDRILQVNGTGISTFSQSEAITFLRNSAEIVTLRLCRDCNGLISCPVHAVPKVDTFNVIVEKRRNEALGFSVWNSVDVVPDVQKNLLPCAAEVKIVYPGSLAYKNGIKVGDRILEVNAEGLLSKTADEVTEILQKTSGVIRMVFCRLL